MHSIYIGLPVLKILVEDFNILLNNFLFLK